MDKRNTYLVYDAEEETSETGSLRERLENDFAEAQAPADEPVKPVKEKKEKSKKLDKSSKKFIEKILIGIIALVSVAISGILVLFVTGGTPEIIINSEQQTKIVLFDYTAEYSQKINGHFTEIRELLLEYRENPQTDITTPLITIKERVDAQSSEFLAYKEDYYKHYGNDVFDTYVSRMFNLSKLVNELMTVKSPQEAIDLNNARILKDEDYGVEAMVYIKK